MKMTRLATKSSVVLSESAVVVVVLDGRAVRAPDVQMPSPSRSVEKLGAKSQSFTGVVVNVPFPLLVASYQYSLGVEREWSWPP